MLIVSVVHRRVRCVPCLLSNSEFALHVTEFGSWFASNYSGSARHQDVAASDTSIVIGAKVGPALSCDWPLSQ